MKLIRIGYWASETDKSWPDVESFVDPSWDPQEREDVVIYLRYGMLALTYMGYSICRLCGERNGTCELTDGKYLWPEGLAHYVDVHSVRLPAQFVQDAQTTRLSFEDAEVNDDWWANTRDLSAESDSHRSVP